MFFSFKYYQNLPKFLLCDSQFSPHCTISIKWKFLVQRTILTVQCTPNCFDCFQFCQQIEEENLRVQSSIFVKCHSLRIAFWYYIQLFLRCWRKLTFGGATFISNIRRSRCYYVPAKCILGGATATTLTYCTYCVAHPDLT